MDVLSGNNIKVALFPEAVPTPLVSWAVRETGATGGIVITASHNPAEFNGFKIKAPWGGSAPAALTKSVESLVDCNLPRRNTNYSESIEPELISNAVAKYRTHVSEFIDLDGICSAKNRIIIDPMHGAGGRWVESFLKKGSLAWETVRAEGDPKFGGVNPEPIDQHLGVLKSRVKETKAILGLATDGDADRLGAVNELGETMTMHEVAPILLLHLARSRNMTGGVVQTFSQSVLMKRIAAAHNLPLYETPIGFKYIANLMLKENILIGAEESGGIGLQGHIPERDGILNSLLLAEAVIAAGKAPSEIVRDIYREFGEFCFGRIDIKMNVADGQYFVKVLGLCPPTAVDNQLVTGVETLDGTKLLFADESWLLFRQSGTEPLLRIYSEATSQIKKDCLLLAGKLMAINEKKI
jgi:phosphomannomutase